MASHKVEDRWQDEHSRAFGQARNNAKDQSQVVNEDGSKCNDKEVAEAD